MFRPLVLSEITSRTSMGGDKVGWEGRGEKKKGRKYKESAVKEGKKIRGGNQKAEKNQTAVPRHSSLG